MKRRLLASILAFVIVLGLLPTAALATDGAAETGETVVLTGYVPSGVKKNDDGSYANINSTIQYKITSEADGNQTLTFWSKNGNAKFPTFKIETQALTADGTTVQTSGASAYTSAQSVAANEKDTYPNGYVTDTADNKHALDAAYIPYLWCTGNVYHYSKLPWYGNREKITKVVFEESIAAFGQFTVCHMPNLKEVVIKNENCQVGGNAIYFNEGQQQSSLITVTLPIGAIEKLAKNAVSQATSVRYSFNEVETYKETYADVFNGTNAEKAQEAWNDYQAFPDAAKQQLQADTIGEIGITYYEKLVELAEAGKINTSTVVEDALCKGSETVRYELSTNDGGDTYRLRFYNLTGDGVMPNYVVSSSSEMCYSKAMAWYAPKYREKITEIIYDTSITQTGELTAAHFTHCQSIEFRNPDVTISKNTVHYNNGQKVPEVLHLHISAKTASAWYGGWRSDDNGVSKAEFDKYVSISYYEVEEFEKNNQDFFAAETTPSKEDVQVAWNTVAAWPSAARAQLERDLIPGGEQSYMARLNVYAKEHGLSEMDSSEIVTGVCPATTGIHYELRSYDGGKTYALRFYADSSSNGKMANYVVTYTDKEPLRSSPLAYENLPWRNTSEYTITSCTFNRSITYVGQFVMANIKSCTLYKFENPTVDVHENAIYFYDDNFVDTNGVTIELHATANMNGGPGGSVSQDALARVHFSYAEAKDFIAKYQELWTLSESEADDKIDTIKAAQKELSALPKVAQDQLNTDKIPETETTYAAKLTQLMATLKLGGSCGEDANYALTDNGNGTYTLLITGSGALEDYSTASAPWAGHSAQITKVTIGSGITKLTKGAFSGLTKLKSVDVPESVTEIAEGALPETDATKFDLYGYSNHASGRYAEAHSNVQLRLKSLRILCMGNSHTGDYTQYLQNALNDMKKAGVETNITYTLSPSAGGRQLYYWPKQNLSPEERKAQDDRGSHYWSAKDPNADVIYHTYDKYQNTFKSTWDLIVVQDFHESTAKAEGTYPGGAKYATAMQEVVKWLNDAAPGAKIAWFADWAEKASNSGNLDVSYANSVAAMNAIAALTKNKPDYIIPASTVLQNARTSYLGTVHNPSNVLLNNKKSNGDYVFKDCAVDNMQAYTVLERDGTHMSLELGRQLMATAFVYNLLKDYDQQIITPKDFDLFAALNTQPEYKNGNCYWLGEMTADNWAIIKEACENANTSSRTVTNSIHTTDPFDSKYAHVKAIIAGVTRPEPLSQEALNEAFKSDAVVSALNAIDGISVTKDSISVTYQAAVDGTEENPAGKDGKLVVTVDCHYGYTYPTTPALNMILKANMEPGAEAALEELKQTAINKLKSYMHNDSYAGIYQEQVKTAKDNGIAAITVANSEGEVTQALYVAEDAIDHISTQFASKNVPDYDCVAIGQIWTGGWNHEEGGSGGIEKNYYTLDYTNSPDKKDSTFTGVWWVIRNDGEGGYSLEFCKDFGTDYSFEIPDYNANHWLDTWHVHKSYNPLQYNKTPWRAIYGQKITSVTIDSGITVGTFTLACFPNIRTYTIQDNVTLNADSIYFNPIQTDVNVKFEGSAKLAKGAISAYSVQNSYAYYVDVYGDLSQVKKTDGSALSGNLSYAFGQYRADSQSFDPSSGTYYMNATGLYGAPHYTDGVPDGTKMLRVFNSNKTTHTHKLVTIPAVNSCGYNLNEGSYCSDCGATVKAQVATKGTGSHQWKLTNTADPAVDKEGYKTYTCSVCHVEKVESIPATAVARIVNPVTKEVKNYDNVEDAVKAAAGQVGDSGTTDVTVNLVPGYNLPDGTTGSGVTIDKGKGTIKVTDHEATITVPVHSFSETWNYDETNHWHACTVEGHTDKNGLEPHAGVTATCTEQAICSTCGQKYGELAKHTLKKTETKAATCTATGNSAYWTCDVCGKFFSDENGETGITENSWVIPASGHTWSTVWSKNETTHWHECTNCYAKNDEAAHTPGPAATEEQPQTCTECGYELNPELGHQHKLHLTPVAEKAATCKEAGNIAYWCCKCGNLFKDADATVSVTAEQVTTPKDLTNHVGGTEVRNAKDATYTEEGYTGDTYCLGCNTKLTSGTVIPKLMPAPTPVIPVTPSEPAKNPFNPDAGKTRFVDVSDNAWYASAVNYVVDKGLMNGTGEDKFSPNADTTRGMIVTVLARLDGKSTAGTPWFAAGQRWAMEYEISDGTNMTGAITREQLVAMLFRYAVKNGLEAVTLSENLTQFTDASDISAWAVSAMQWAVGQGLIQGSNGQLRPQANASRAEVATILMRFCELMKK